MKVLYCASECDPFAASGGLGVVAGSLPAALRQRLVGCRVVMPYYSCIPQELKNNMKFLVSFTVQVAWRRQYCGVFELHHEGIVYYFIDNQYYFNRDGIYGFYDDAERYAFFSRACLEMLPHIDFKPDIIHCNDWQTALVPVYYNVFYSKNEWYSGIKTIFTIHNIQYQGKYLMDINTEVVGLPETDSHIIEYDGKANFMKGAIETANRVSTVSPSYAQEIKNPWFSYGLDGILREREWKLRGILNGIENKDYDPGTDCHLYNNYWVDNLDGKSKCKSALQQRLGLQQRWEIPIIAMVTRIVAPKGIDLVCEGFEQLMSREDVQVVIHGSGDEKYEDFFRDMQRRYPGKVCYCCGYYNELARKIYSGADLLLMPSRSEPCGLSQMIALRYGTIPIVREVGGLKDSIIDSGGGDGNGFTFSKYDTADMLNAIRRAIAGYWRRDDWWILVQRAMRWDNSWARSAGEYIQLYKEALST